MNYKHRPSGILVPGEPMRVGGVWHGLILRDGEVIDEFEHHNLVVNQGIDHMLATEFTAGAPVTQWYMAPFGANYVPVGSDTAVSIVANANEITTYGGQNRAPYSAVEGSQQVTNAGNGATFTFTSGGNVYGAFLISSQAKSSTAGVLFSAGVFGSPKPVDVNDQLVLTYSIGLASA